MDDSQERTAPALLEERKSALRARLEDGYARITVAQLAGEDVERWEDFWIALLRTYEALCDEATESDRAA